MEIHKRDDLIKKAPFVDSRAETLKPVKRIIILYMRGKQGF